HEVASADLAAGSILAPVGLSGGFVITAGSGELRSAPRSLSLLLTSGPRILSTRLEPARGVTAGRGERGTVTLSWVVEGADRPLLLEMLPGGSVNLVEHSNRIDAIELDVDGPTELRLTALSEAGSHEVLLVAPVFQPPTVLSLDALPSRA